MDLKSEDVQKKIIELLSEIVKWEKFQAIQMARQALSEIIKKDAEKIVYHYSDGRSSKEIAEIAGVSDFTVRSYWKKWASLGLVISSEKFKGRYEKLFSLEELGIEVPVRSINFMKEKIGPKGEMA